MKNLNARLIPILLEQKMIDADVDFLEDYYVFRGEEDA